MALQNFKLQFKLLVAVEIVSAEELKEVGWFGKTYVVAWVRHKDSSSRIPKLGFQATGPCKGGGRNPRWNQKLHFTVTQRQLQSSSDFCLAIFILHQGVLGMRTTVATVNIPLSELLNIRSGELPHVAYPLHRPSGRSQGKIRLATSCKEVCLEKLGASSTEMAALRQWDKQDWSEKTPSAQHTDFSAPQKRVHAYGQPHSRYYALRPLNA